MNKIWAIPGFLGLPSDWDFFKNDSFRPVDLALCSLDSLNAWAREFNQKVKSQQSESSLLMGYSLGGRLALHALMDAPKQWKAAIIISAHPGLKEKSDRENRRLHDERWSRRFLHENWQSIINDWNHQEVFLSEEFQFERKEKDYHREQLSQILVNLSLSCQEDLTKKINELKMPILWITGKNDEKFSSLAKNFKFSHPNSKKVEIENTGHRAPWSQSKLFLEVINEFIHANA